MTHRHRDVLGVGLGWDQWGARGPVRVRPAPAAARLEARGSPGRGACVSWLRGFLRTGVTGSVAAGAAYRGRRSNQVHASEINKWR